MGYGLNHDQVELMKGPTLSSSLPVVFDNSEKIDGIVMRCPECDRTVPDVLARCQKGSKRRAHVKQHVARLHEKIGNSRTDTMHKFSTSMVQRFDVIYIEDLNLRGMLKNHSLARALSDASIGQAARMLEEKAERCGKRVERIDRWYPSSKTCSACGHIQESMPLSVRDWTCPSCDTRHDRDVNAAVNIVAVGQTVSAHGGTVRRSRATASERKSPRSANRQAATSG